MSVTIEQTAVITCASQSEYNDWKSHIQSSTDSWIDSAEYDDVGLVITVRGTQNNAWLA